MLYHTYASKLSVHNRHVRMVTCQNWGELGSKGGQAETTWFCL